LTATDGRADKEIRLDNASLTKAHVAVCTVEEEMRAAGRTEAADGLAYADLIILMVWAKLPVRPMLEGGRDDDE